SECAFSGRRISASFVGRVGGRKAAYKFLLDQVRGLLSFSATIAAVRILSAKWPNPHRKLVEDKANGTAVIDSLKHEISGIAAGRANGADKKRAGITTRCPSSGNP